MENKFLVQKHCRHSAQLFSSVERWWRRKNTQNGRSDTKNWIRNSASLKRDGYNHIQKNNCADMTLSIFFFYSTRTSIYWKKKRKRKSTLLEFWSEIKWLSQAQFHHRGTEQRHKKNSDNNKNKKNVFFSTKLGQNK